MMPPDSGGRRRRLYLCGALLSLSVALTTHVSATASVLSTPSSKPDIVIFDECRIWEHPIARFAPQWYTAELIFNGRSHGKDLLFPPYLHLEQRHRARAARPSYAATRTPRPRAAALTKLTRLSRRYAGGQFT